MLDVTLKSRSKTFRHCKNNPQIMFRKNPQTILLILFIFILILALVSVSVALLVTQTTLMDDWVASFFGTVVPSR